MSTKQDMVNFIQNEEPEAYALIGKNDTYKESYLVLWAEGKIFSSTYDRWFIFYQAEGDSLHLKNVIRNFLNEPSEGFTDGKTNQQRLGDQYRGYIAIAASVVSMSQKELSDLQTEATASGTSPNRKLILATQIQIQISTIAHQKQNLRTWQTTLDNTIASGRAV